ncbi:MAG: S-layer homology domain-containing protein [Clostridiales Family XIII bacterium]|jgi:hypothetical protein|nr:S-layer homology domain-containing protein [Clostridiales Family XIII bacterium]
MKTIKKTGAFFVVLALLLALAVFVQAKTIPAGQTVGNVLFYITNAKGEEILVSRLPVSEMEADMQAGKINATLHNYSLLDRFVTTLHQEAQGFTVPEFIDYAKGKSPVAALRALPLSLEGQSSVQFWEIDRAGYDEADTYTYGELYGVQRYNFPLLYEYWDYEKQDYCDPAGKLTREAVIDRIFAHGEPETVLLSVRAFSQRYMVTSEKFREDYNMEGYWQSQGLLDNDRTMRIMKPMTKDELYNKTPTANDTRYWTANIRLNMADAPGIAPLGVVAAPTAALTETSDNYYIRFSCETPGATILYNHNFSSPSYTPTALYGDDAVAIPKSAFPGGIVTMTARAVKEGFGDAGVVTLTLKPAGAEQSPESAASASTYSDVPAGAWYEEAVRFVMEKGLFDLTGKSDFSPEAPMTRAMLVTALYRLDGSPSVASFVEFDDVTKGTPLSAAVSWASGADVVNGMGDGTFAPDARITREQIAAMLHRYALHGGAAEGAAGDLSGFSDADAVSDWAAESMRLAVGRKLVSGMGDGTLNPQGTATRAQVARILLNYVNYAK